MSKNNPLCKVADVVTIDPQTGEEVPVEGGGAYLLPAPPDTCQWCAVDHEPESPHNQQSLYYQMKFHGIHKRWPTWTDAMAHCNDEMKATWREMIVERMKAHGMPIPEDLKESP